MQRPRGSDPKTWKQSKSEPARGLDRARWELLTALIAEAFVAEVAAHWAEDIGQMDRVEADRAPVDTGLADTAVDTGPADTDLAGTVAAEDIAVVRDKTAVGDIVAPA